MLHQYLDWKQIKNNNFSNFKDMEKKMVIKFYSLNDFLGLDLV